MAWNIVTDSVTNRPEYSCLTPYNIYAAGLFREGKLNVLIVNESKGSRCWAV
jgi:hypothetical protein